VAWYSLGEGIEDTILKSLHNGIIHYDIGERSDEDVIRDVIVEFFKHYGGVTLPNGAKAKIAFYFKTQAHLDISRLHIEKTLAELGENPTLILVNTQRSTQTEIDEFNRLNDPSSQKRILLLIAKGVEGWNCPSLFACALIKEQTTSSNFVLQASTRCLRQVPGNTQPAKIFLDTKNRSILDKELQDNFGTTLQNLGGHTAATKEIELRIRKPELPELQISRLISRVVRKEHTLGPLQLTAPAEDVDIPPIHRATLTPNFKSGPSPLTGITGIDEIPLMNRSTDCYTLSRRIAANYHLPYMQTLKSLKQLYPDGEVPNTHLHPLYQQVEKQLQNYDVIDEEVTETLALIRTLDEKGKPVFDDEADGYYIHRLRLLKRTVERMEAGGLLFDEGDLADAHDVSFHYAPYNFDSIPERRFFEEILNTVNASGDDINLFLFTGGLTDPNKTDFHFEYKGIDGNYHRYFPDFVIVKKTGQVFIVEIKAESERNDETVQAKSKAVERLQKLQVAGSELKSVPPFKYHVVYTTTNLIQENLDTIRPVINWIRPTEDSETGGTYENYPG